jgi:hypothetical protein
MQYYWRAVTIQSPCYYISYATSATASYNLYLEAQTNISTAYQKYMYISEQVDGAKFLGALTAAGIASPFDENVFKGYATLLGK